MSHPQASSGASERHRVPLLDGVRGLAILAVLIFHAFFERAPHSAFEYAIRKATAPLWIGVNIFFVLSGFLITGILIDTKEAPHYFRSFYARRTLRIFPLYFAALGCVFFLLPAMHLLPRVSSSEQVSYWTYTYNWSAALGYGAPELVPFWSLSVEEQFYLFWPVLLYIIPVRRMPAVFMALLSASFLFRLAVFVLNDSFRYAYFLTPARLEDICFGALAAWVVRDARSLERWRPHMTRLFLVFACLFGAALAAGKGFEANKWPALLFGTSGVCGMTALLIVKSTFETRARWWGRGPLQWLGTYSYGLYVLHQPIIYFADKYFLDASFPVYTLAMLCALCASCAAAYASYHAFERPFLKLKRLFPAI